MLNMLTRMERATGCDNALLGRLIKNSGKSVRKIAGEILETTDVKVSATLLWRLNGKTYDFVVKESKRIAICEYFRAQQDELFPFVGANEEKAS